MSARKDLQDAAVRFADARRDGRAGDVVGLESAAFVLAADQLDLVARSVGNPEASDLVEDLVGAAHLKLQAQFVRDIAPHVTVDGLAEVHARLREGSTLAAIILRAVAGALVVLCLHACGRDRAVDAAPVADAGVLVDAVDRCATCCLPSNQDSAHCCALVDGGAPACTWWGSWSDAWP